MRALHLPGVPVGEKPVYEFPDNPAPPTALEYSESGFPDPKARPDLKETSYLIQVHATALTRDELTWDETLAPSRFHPHGGAIPGKDVVGTIAAVYAFPKTDSQSPTPKADVGDQVWGLVDADRDGAAATYTIAYESELSRIPTPPTSPPDSAWLNMLATIPLSGLTAYQALFTHSKLSLPPNPTTAPPIRVLVTGAAGSVGTLFVQLAHALNVDVTAVCSSRSKDFLTSKLHVPPDSLIDYTSPGFTSVPAYMRSQNIPEVDMVLDCVGGSTLASMLLEAGCVKAGGKVVSIYGPVSVLGDEIAQQIEERGKMTEVENEFFIVKPNGAQLEELGKLVAEGKFTGFVDQVFPLSQGRKAMEKVQSRGTVGYGKVVLQVGD